MYVRLDEKELKMLEEVSKLTITDYELISDFIPADSLLCAIEDLLNEIHYLEEKIEDIEKDIEDNYRRISVASQVDINDKDFI